MNDQIKKYIATGMISAAFAVALGAFGAHGLKSAITPHYLDVFETGNKYHFIHSLGLIISIYILAKLGDPKITRRVFMFFLIGIILFSGSLYILSIADLIGMPQLKFMGAITPIGGVFFILAWAYSAFVLLKRT